MKNILILTVSAVLFSGCMSPKNRESEAKGSAGKAASKYEKIKQSGEHTFAYDLEFNLKGFYKAAGGEENDFSIYLLDADKSDPFKKSYVYYVSASSKKINPTFKLRGVIRTENNYLNLQLLVIEKDVIFDDIYNDHIMSINPSELASITGATEKVSYSKSSSSSVKVIRSNGELDQQEIVISELSSHMSTVVGTMVENPLKLSLKRIVTE